MANKAKQNKRTTWREIKVTADKELAATINFRNF